MDILKKTTQQLRLVNALVGHVSKHGFAAAAAAATPAPTRPEGGGARDLKFILASATKALYSNVVVKQVDVPGMTCSMGILPIHVPMIAVLKPGILTVHEVDGNMAKFLVSSGTCSMNIDGTCQILVEEIAALDELDTQAAKQLLDESNKKSIDVTSSDVEKAEAQIQAEVADAVIKATGG